MKKRRNIVRIFFETIYGGVTPEKKEQADLTHKVYRSFRAKARSERRWYEKAADNITTYAGSISFVVFHIIFFSLWLGINLGYLPAYPIFDPFPFGLLTMIVSLEAIFLSIFVLVSQNREGQINDLREEVNFQINMHSEQEVTKLIHMVNDIHDHLGLSKRRDSELEAMKKRLDPEKLEEEIKEEYSSS